jgi:hypothetical protein
MAEKKSQAARSEGAQKTEDTRSEGANVEQAEAQVQEAVDQETEQGFRGVEVDRTDNRAYTVAGQAEGAEVPEAAADPVAARREASTPKD